MNEQIRSAFHRHLLSRGIPSDLFQHDDLGVYEFPTVEHDWEVWQAALANSSTVKTPGRERAASLVASEDTKRLDWERELIAAAQAVIERWDTPLWKDAPHTAIFINRMREAIDAAQASAGEAQS